VSEGPCPLPLGPPPPGMGDMRCFLSSSGLAKPGGLLAQRVAELCPRHLSAGRGRGAVMIVLGGLRHEGAEKQKEAIVRHTKFFRDMHFSAVFLWGSSLTEEAVELLGARSVRNEEVPALLQALDCCYVSGGNTWGLAQFVDETFGTWLRLVSRVKQGRLVYLSASAGSILAGSNIHLNRDNVPQLPGTEEAARCIEGLSLVPFVVIPHVRYDEIPRWTRELRRTHCTACFLYDGTALMSAGGVTGVVGKAKALARLRGICEAFTAVPDHSGWLCNREMPA
jgi:hypothetical protein